MSGLWSELKRRNVVRVGLAYAAAGWVVVQAATVLFPMFDAPAWVPRAVTILVFLGFPLALVMSWLFDLTPQGVQRTEAASSTAASSPSTARRLDFVIIGVLAVALALFTLDKFVLNRTASEAGDGTQGAAAGSVRPAAGGPLDSIAVLPFVNMSNDPEQEYLSDGIAEELLHALTRVKPLKVAARTSAFSFKGKNVDLREIGHALNVATVLEGSVRKSGNRLRITAQLIDVESGFHLWSETYDRELTDVFAIQDDITAQIVSALQPQLADPAVARVPSRSADVGAYELMLRGRYQWNLRTPEGFQKAAELLQEAIRREPGYALAHSALADVYLSQFDYGLLSWAESNRRARSLAEKAIELDESLAAAQTSLAHVLLHEWQWQAAERSFLKAIELDPSYTLALHWHALSLTALGRTDEAVEAMRHAQRLDPLSMRLNVDLGMAYLAAGQYQDAVQQEGRALELAPGAATPQWITGMALEQLGRYEEAEANMKAADRASPDNDAIKGSLGHLYAISGRTADARGLIAELTSRADGGDVAFFIALIFAGLNDNKAALTWLERAVDERSGSVRYLKVDPRLADLRREPRYRQLMVRVGLPQ